MTNDFPETAVSPSPCGESRKMAPDSSSTSLLSGASVSENLLTPRLRLHIAMTEIEQYCDIHGYNGKTMKTALFLSPLLVQKLQQAEDRLDKAFLQTWEQPNNPCTQTDWDKFQNLYLLPLLFCYMKIFLACNGINPLDEFHRSIY